MNAARKSGKAKHATRKHALAKSAPKHAMPKVNANASTYVGRVGALAVALGVGAAVTAWMPLGFAETSDSASAGSEGGAPSADKPATGSAAQPSTGGTGSSTGGSGSSDSDSTDSTGSGTKTDSDSGDAATGDDTSGDDDSTTDAPSTAEPTGTKAPEAADPTDTDAGGTSAGSSRSGGSKATSTKSDPEPAASAAESASTDAVDLGSDRDVGPGRPLWLVVAIKVALGGTTPTFNFSIQTDDNSSFSSAATLAASGDSGDTLWAVESSSSSGASFNTVVE